MKRCNDCGTIQVPPPPHGVPYCCHCGAFGTLVDVSDDLPFIVDDTAADSE